jgi:hypothetical protein
MFAVHEFGFLFWIVVALVFLWAGVRLWPRVGALLLGVAKDGRSRRRASLSDETKSGS